MSGNQYEIGCKEWREYELEHTASMVDLVKGADPLGEEGIDLTVERDLLTCEAGPNDIPIIKADGNLVYFPSAYSFHPDAQPAEDNSVVASKITKAYHNSGRVFVVDTGWRGSIPAHKSGTPHDIDPLTTDVVHGHGPAIVGLIDQLTGPEVDVALRQVRFSEGATKNANGQPLIPVFTCPHGTMNQNKPGKAATFRGFDSQALCATLYALLEEDDLHEGDVVNLSLGAVADQETFYADPVYEWLEHVKGEGVRVVVAAGNHGTIDKSWPAARADGDLIFSVGSGSSNNPDTFSARNEREDTWITHWENGSNVPVVHPALALRNPPTDCNAKWTGTSFAAPRFAASLFG